MLAISLAQHAAAESLQRLTAVPRFDSALLSDAADGQLDHFSLVRGALVAGGVHAAPELDQWEARFERTCQPLDLQQAAGNPPTVETLFAFLHRELLTGSYNAAVTTLPITLGQGDYNCLTATTLFVALCDRYGVRPEIVSTTGHIYCRLPGVSPLEIETTCRDWFQSGFDRSGANGGQRPAARGGRTINRVQLLGKIYYNRGVALLAERRFAEALPLVERSQLLDPHDADARENLLAGLNNWALSLADAGHYEAAAKLIARGQSLDPAYAPLSANELHVHQRWAAKLCDEHQFAKALELLTAGHHRQPTAPLYVAGPQTVYEAWIRWHLERGESALAAKVAAEAKLGNAEESEQ